MGAGNPGYKFQDKAYDKEYPSNHIAYPSTYFYDYISDDDDDLMGIEFWDALTFLAEASGLPEVYGEKGERDDDCCMGFRDSAIVIAQGKHCKLVAKDGDMGRIAFSIIPISGHDDFINYLIDEDWNSDVPREPDDLNKHVESMWNEYLKLYEAEANAAGHAIHKAYPDYGFFHARSGPWMSSAMPAYDPNEILLTFY